MKIERYRCFDRLFPRVRASYSLYHNWIKNDWESVFRYITRTEMRSTKAMETGKKGHSFLELYPPAEIRKIVGEGRGESEKFIIVKRDDYDLVGVVDWLINDYVVDYKFGSIKGYDMQVQNYMFMTGKKKALLAQFEPIWEAEEIVGAKLKRTAEYDRDKQKIEEWQLIIDEMVNSIRLAVHDGTFEDFCRANVPGWF